MHRKQERTFLLGLLFLGITAAPSLGDETELLSMRLAVSQPKKGWTKKTIPADNKQPAEVVYVSSDVILTHNGVKSAKLDRDLNGQLAITFEMTKAGAKKLRKATAGALRDHQNGNPSNSKDSTEAGNTLKTPRPRMAILFKGKVLVAPTLVAEFGKKCMIVGRFTKNEAKRIVTALQAEPRRR